MKIFRAFTQNGRLQYLQIIVATMYGSYRPSGQGIAALQILNILEDFDIKKMGLYSSEYIHLFTEAKKLAFADRAKYYADPSFSDIPVQELISKDYAKERAKNINFSKAAMIDEPGILKNGDTIYLTAADQYGNMISLIQSNYRGMGSGMMPPGLGFMLQDRGELFSLDPSHKNALSWRQAPFPYYYPSLCNQGWQALYELWSYGRCNTTSSSCSNCY